MLRKSVVALAVLAAMNAPQASALGLGEVTVHSALNQPLNAEINLLQLRDLSETQIIASLADADDFYLAGVKPTTVLSDINFQLEIKNGKGMIKLSTNQPIREPFLNFLVEVNWPSGRLVREYTVLLDPPVFTPKDLSPRPAPMLPKSSMDMPAMQSEPMKPMAAPLPSSAVAPSVQGGQYKVGKKDTLWDIALKTRPDRSISPQQMMLALQRMNPEAFVNNNINRLKSGVVLTIPTREQIAEIDRMASLAEVKRQNSAWKGGVAPKDKAPAAPRTEQLDAGKPEESGAAIAAEEEQSQLRIVSQPVEEKPEETMAAEEKSVSVDATESSEAAQVSEELLAKNQELEEQLVVTLEGLDKVERDNAELFDRLDKLTNQLDSMQQLLTLKDQQMNDLQSKLAEAQAAPPPPPPASAKSFLDTLLASPAILGGALAALLAALLALFFVSKRRKNADDEQAVEKAMEALEEREKDAAPVVAGAAVAEEVFESTAEEPESTVADENDPFDMASDDISDEFDSLISDDLDQELGEDLNMDLDIDEPVEEDPEMAEFAASLMDEEDFDLSVAEEEATPEVAVADTDLEAELAAASIDQETAEGLDLDLTESDLDNLMDEAFESADEAAESSEEAEADLSDDLDFILADHNKAEIEPEAETETGEEDFASGEVDLDDLDALLSESEATVSDEFEAEEAVVDDLDVSADLENMLADSEKAVTSSGLDLVDEHDDEEESPLLEDADLDALITASEEAAEQSVAEPEESSDLDMDFSNLSLDDEIAEAEEPAEPELVEEIDAALAVDAADALVEDLGAEPFEEETPVIAAPAVAETAIEDELDNLADDDLEAELDMALAEEGNELSLDEMDLAEEEGDLDYLEGADELGTKLDLARAYIDMDDLDGAREILDEVVKAGDAIQAEEARKLLEMLD